MGRSINDLGNQLDALVKLNNDRLGYLEQTVSAFRQDILKLERLHDPESAHGHGRTCDDPSPSPPRGHSARIYDLKVWLNKTLRLLDELQNCNLTPEKLFDLNKKARKILDKDA